MALKSWKNYETKKENEYEQIRTLYKNGGKVMARITKNIYIDKVVEILNFKDDNLNDSILKVSRESKNLKITNENKEFITSLLEILDLVKVKELIRKRYVYKKKEVTFELDKYSSPLMNVVAIEGKKKRMTKFIKKLVNIII